MDKVHYLPSIVVEPSTSENRGNNNEDTSEVSLCASNGDAQALNIDAFHRNIFRRCWVQLCAVYKYWQLFTEVPFDLFSGALLKTSRSDFQARTSINSMQSQPWNLQSPPPILGQLALHPRLPLLAVSSSIYPEIQFYSTETSLYLWKFQIKLPKGTEDDPIKKPGITCLCFSNGKHLAVGLRDGTVRVVQQDLRSMMKSSSNPQANRELKIYVIKLLPSCSSKDNAMFLGAVTNLAFSPYLSAEEASSIWLAITTHQSGVWIWNRKTEEVVRTMSTKGVNQGCFQWIRLSPEASEPYQPDISSSEEKQLSKSTVQKWTGVYGDVDDIFKLDEYFSSPEGSFTSSNLSSVSKSTSLSSYTTLSDSNVSKMSSKSSNVNTRNGQSLMVIGTKNGILRAQKLWHSPASMQMETFAEFLPFSFIQPQGEFPFKPPSMAEAITHLAIRPHKIRADIVNLPVLIALRHDNSSNLHEFHISIPSLQPQTPLPEQLRQLATTCVRSLVNLSFILTQTPHRWLTLPPPRNPTSALSITHHITRPVHETPRGKPLKSTLTSISNPQFPIDLFLATLRPDPSQSFGRPKTSLCMLFSAPSIQFTNLTPTTPFPNFPTSKITTTLHGYYTRMLAKAESYDDKARRGSSGRARAQTFCNHDFASGQVAWGVGGKGRVVGAYLYQPASLLDAGLGVGMFEIAAEGHTLG